MYFLIVMFLLLFLTLFTLAICFWINNKMWREWIRVTLTLAVLFGSFLLGWWLITTLDD